MIVRSTHWPANGTELTTQCTTDEWRCSCRPFITRSIANSTDYTSWRRVVKIFSCTSTQPLKASVHLSTSGIYEQRRWLRYVTRWQASQHGRNWRLCSQCAALFTGLPAGRCQFGVQKKNTHSHFLSYLHELFVDLTKKLQWIYPRTDRFWQCKN